MDGYSKEKLPVEFRSFKDELELHGEKEIIVYDMGIIVKFGKLFSVTKLRYERP